MLLESGVEITTNGTLAFIFADCTGACRSHRVFARMPKGRSADWRDAKWEVAQRRDQTRSADARRSEVDLRSDEMR